MPSWRQIARAVPNGISRWRGTVTGRSAVGLRQTSCREPWRTRSQPLAIRCCSSSRSEVTRRSISSRCRAQYPLGMELHVVFEPDEEGWVRASIEELPGVITCAPTRDEARQLIRDALDEWLAALTSTDRATTRLEGTRETLTVIVT